MNEAMNTIRQETQEASNETLMGIWQTSKNSTELSTMALNAIIETELEKRGLIKLDEETMEYEIL